MLKIEKNVPIKKQSSTSVFETMDFGDSFFIENRKKGIMEGAKLRTWAKINKTDALVITRKEGNGTRVWLMKKEN